MPQNTQGFTGQTNVTPMNYGFETLAIHAGQEPDPRTGAVVPPIYATSTYAQDEVGAPRLGYEYSRSANPTRTALQECLAALEGGPVGLAFASGLAADRHAGADGLPPRRSRGDPATTRTAARSGCSQRSWSGGASRGRPSISPTWMPLLPRWHGRRGLVWCETPTNPLLNIADIAAVAALAHEAGALLAVDNTFASPYLQRPIELGADVVVHSHDEVPRRALRRGRRARSIAADGEVGAELAYHQNAMGTVSGPFDAWLVSRSLRTLAVRMERHCDNAEAVVDCWRATTPSRRSCIPACRLTPATRWRRVR